MLKGPLVLASFGLGLNLLLWGVPGMVAGSAAAHWVVPSQLSGTLASVEERAGPTPSLPDALVILIGTESEALQVAGEGLKQPTAPDLASRANAAGAHVETAIATYLRAAQAVVRR